MVRTNFLTFSTGGSKIWGDNPTGPSQPPMAEHSMVALAAPVATDDGRTLPAGARGAIVFVHEEGTAYMVEFATPFHAVVTVPAVDLSQAPAAA